MIIDAFIQPEPLSTQEINEKLYSFDLPIYFPGLDRITQEEWLIYLGVSDWMISLIIETQQRSHGVKQCSHGVNYEDSGACPACARKFSANKDGKNHDT